MNLSESIKGRRTGVALNYTSVLSLIILFVLHREFDWGIWSVALLALLLLFTIASFIIVYWKTGLWTLVHAKKESLDERQMQVTYDALQHSYAVFSVFTLLAIFYFAWKADDWSMLFFGVLVYVSHILPASIIAWKEKIVSR
jgi:hypothetical protein